MKHARPTSLRLALALLALATPLTLRAQATATAPEVAATVNAFHTALATGDTAAILDLLAPDARILEGGGVETVEQYAGGHMPADIAFAQAVPRERSELNVVVQGDVAWVTSTSRAVGSYRGREVDSRGGELMVLSRGPDGGWKIRSISWS